MKNKGYNQTRTGIYHTMKNAIIESNKTEYCTNCGSRLEITGIVSMIDREIIC